VSWASTKQLDEYMARLQTAAENVCRPDAYLLHALLEHARTPRSSPYLCE